MDFLIKWKTMWSSEYGPRKYNERRQKEDKSDTPLKSSRDSILTYGYEEEDRCLHFEY
ncbi:hypothetical protein Gotur_006669 [Gossypium turneri]